MSAAVKTTQEAAPAKPPAGRLEVSAQLLDFEPGLYSVEVSCPETTRPRDGLVLPCIQLEPVATQTGRAHVASLTDSALIMPGAHPAYLRVEGTKASVLLTIYKAPGAKVAPDLRIRLIGRADAPPPAKPAKPILPSLKLTLLAHVEREGDLTAGGGEYVGGPGGGAIEGFAITPAGGLSPADIEYQAVLGSDWSTPWVAGGGFCGSRGLALPLLGVRIRLVGEAAQTHRCEYWGSFHDKGEVGPLTEGAPCAGDGAHLEALRVVITEAPAAAAPTPEKAAAKQPARAPAPPPKPALRAPAPAKPKPPAKRPVPAKGKPKPRRR